MNAEIGIDEEGRAYIALSCLTATEYNTLQFMKAFLPVRVSPTESGARIVGERLPGSGKGV